MDDFFGNPGAPKKLPLTGLCFSIAGMVDNISNMECRQLVIDNGANFYDTVSSGVTHLISSSDMEVVFDNEYKCQFFPTLRPQVTAVSFFQVTCCMTLYPGQSQQNSYCINRFCS